MFKDVHCNLIHGNNKKRTQWFNYGTCSMCVNIENCSHKIKI